VVRIHSPRPIPSISFQTCCAESVCLFCGHGKNAATRLSSAAPAAAEFQKILRHRGMVGNSPLGSLAHLGVARAQFAGLG